MSGLVGESTYSEVIHLVTTEQPLMHPAAAAAAQTSMDQHVYVTCGLFERKRGLGIGRGSAHLGS